MTTLGTEALRPLIFKEADDRGGTLPYLDQIHLPANRRPRRHVLNATAYRTGRCDRQVSLPSDFRSRARRRAAGLVAVEGTRLDSSHSPELRGRKETVFLATKALRQSRLRWPVEHDQIQKRNLLQYRIARDVSSSSRHLGVRFVRQVFYTPRRCGGPKTKLGGGGPAEWVQGVAYSATTDRPDIQLRNHGREGPRLGGNRGIGVDMVGLRPLEVSQTNTSPAA